jgi:hypothetical protein
MNFDRSHQLVIHTLIYNKKIVMNCYLWTLVSRLLIFTSNQLNEGKRSDRLNPEKSSVDSPTISKNSPLFLHIPPNAARRTILFDSSHAFALKLTGDLSETKQKLFNIELISSCRIEEKDLTRFEIRISVIHIRRT